MRGETEKVTHRPTEMANDDESQGSLFISQEEKDFRFLVPCDDANMCFLPSQKKKKMNMEERSA